MAGPFFGQQRRKTLTEHWPPKPAESFTTARIPALKGVEGQFTARNCESGTIGHAIAGTAPVSRQRTTRADSTALAAPNR